MADLASAASSARDTVGRYFTVVSIVPSVVFVLWLIVLIQSGAWSGRPDFGRALQSFASVSVGQSLLAGAATVILGAVLHPVQYTFVQILEGYWGSSELSSRVARLRVEHHRERILRMKREMIALNDEAADLEDQDLASVDTSRISRIDTASQIYDLRARISELERITSFYPTRPVDFMPTRLGNILRSYERDVGKPYGIDSIVVLPYLSRVSAAGDMEYVNDQRSQLDLAARLTVLSGLATVITCLFLARHGVWLLVALAPYLATYLSYRGCIVVAAEYGRALGVLVTLNRFALYDRLALTQPSDTADERVLNKELDIFLRHIDIDGSNLMYERHRRIEEDDPSR